MGVSVPLNDRRSPTVPVIRVTLTATTDALDADLALDCTLIMSTGFLSFVSHNTYMITKRWSVSFNILRSGKLLKLSGLNKIVHCSWCLIMSVRVVSSLFSLLITWWILSRAIGRFQYFFDEKLSSGILILTNAKYEWRRYRGVQIKFWKLAGSWIG